MEIKDLAGISEPLKRLIEVVSEGLGAITRPYLIRRNAEAKAYEIQVIAQAIAESRKMLDGIDYEDGKIKILPPSEATNQLPALAERVANRNEYQEFRRQQNIESVCANAAQELVDNAEVPENKPEPEWVSRFFDIAKDISTEDLQYLWGKILAGEIQKPGSFSLRTLEILKNLSRQEAENFVKLSQYVVRDGSMAFYIDPEQYILTKKDSPSFADILALKDAGLISDSDLLSFSFDSLSAGTTSSLIYGPLVLLFEREKDTPQITSKVGVLTRAGVELLSLVSIEPDMEYVEFALRRFKSEGIKPGWAHILGTEENSIRVGDTTYLSN